MHDTRFGDNDEFLCVRFSRILDDARGASCIIAHGDGFRHTLRMNQYLCLRMLRLCCGNALRRHAAVNRTAAVMEMEALARHVLLQETAEVAVRDETDVLVRQRFHDFLCICRGNNDIGHCLGLAGRIDITDNRTARILLTHLCDIFRRNHMCHRTVRREIRHQDGFFRAEDFRAFAHKTHTAEQDGTLRSVCRNLAQIIGIPDVIGDVLHVIFHIKVRKHYDILFFLELLNALCQLFHFLIVSL